MKLPAWIGRYASHDDPLAAAANQPFYPATVALAVGQLIPVSLWTFLATPGFLAVPALMRRSTLAGRALLVATGIANTLLCLALYGEESGVGLFLLPCSLIAALAFRAGERRVQMPLLGLSLALFIGLHHRMPARTSALDAGFYEGLWTLHAGSVAMLIALIGLVFAGGKSGAAASRGPLNGGGSR